MQSSVDKLMTIAVIVSHQQHTSECSVFLATSGHCVYHCTLIMDHGDHFNVFPLELPNEPFVSFAAHRTHLSLVQTSSSLASCMASIEQCCF